MFQNLRRLAAPLAFLVFSALDCHAQSFGHRIYLAPGLPGDLDSFIAAALVKQHVPVTLVTVEDDAECVIRPFAHEDDSLWHSGLHRYDKDKLEGTVEIINTAKHEIVWAASAGDRSLMFGSMRRSGERKVAERIVKQLRKSGSAGGCMVGDPFK